MSRIFTIPPDLGFADTLAQGLLTEAKGDPLILAQYLILLPNRRAARALREAFLRQSGDRPMLLPRMRTVDEADEDELAFFDGMDIPPAMPTLDRTLLLARLVMAKNPAHTSPAQAVRLAVELGGLLDSLQIERVPPDRLHQLAPDQLAQHWQETLTFLDILLQTWPQILTASQRIDPQERVNRILETQARIWQQHPPATPVIAAGSTGTRPATADLLRVVMKLPQGRIVLPGLDLDLDDPSWDQIDEMHPQYGMKRLLDHLETSRHQVQSFAPPPKRGRARLLSEVMRPARATHAWRHLETLDPHCLNNLTRIDLPTPRDEAGVIALILRQALETEERTAALVTPDRQLAARVRTELLRWNIQIDDSAGRPLAATLPGSLLTLLARACADQLPPHEILALLKHPLAQAQMDSFVYAQAVRRLDWALRGPRPAPGLAGLAQAAQRDKAATALVEQLDYCLGPFLALFQQECVPLSTLLTTHLECAEALTAAPDLPGALRLWADEAGEALALFANQLTEAAPQMDAMDPAHYPALFEQLLAPLVVRPKWGSHPRVFLWGPIEARLQRADVMVLGGLNEGTWPPRPPPDPWMSRPMRQQLGLPLSERRIGLSAHDFAQALGASEVYLTRSLRVDGTPTTPARWLLRLDTVLKATGLKLHGSPDWLHWFRELDRPESPDPIQRPAPRPPLEARPRKLSVTQVETWMRDPYAIYARHILRLRELDPLDADPGIAQYGQFVHKALELFQRTHPGPLPADAVDKLLELGQQAFADALDRPSVRAFWWPRFVSVAHWFIDQERQRRPLIRQSLSEIDGALTLAVGGQDFTVTARADRIDVMPDGSVALIDYKTGKPPSKTEVAAGYAPQLPLEALIARHGGFPGLPPSSVSDLLFWQLKGGSDGGIETHAGDNPQELAQEALEGLTGLVAAFDDPTTPYEARPNPANAPRYSEFGHLERVAEWSTGADDGGSE